MTVLFEAKVGERDIFTVRRSDKGYFVVDRPSPNVVSVIAVTPEKNVVLVQQYREGVKEVCLELPAGIDDKNKPLEQTALEELEEETGYTASSMIPLGSFSKSAGITNEIVHLFRAEGVRKVSKGGGIGDENITIVEIPLENFLNLNALIEASKTVRFSSEILMAVAVLNPILLKDNQL